MLEVEGLAKRYGDVLALKDLTVNVEEGQCLVLLGRNGAGKTTAAWRACCRQARE
jgi:ABC-type multidrug transport system ATPase subunit